MRQVRFRDPAGSVRTGEWIDDENPAVPGDSGQIRFGERVYDPADVEILPPCEPTKLVCVGRNYAAHAEERDEPLPDRPLLFLKGPNAVASHGSEIRLLPGKEQEYEAELAVVIGQQCHNVDKTQATSVIEGYTCMVDISNRTDQEVETNWVRGKAFDGAAPLGPVCATPEHLPEDATVELFLNGERRQSSSIGRLVFSVPELIAEITAYMTLEPGDVIATGTPEGVGPLSDGDHVAVQIDGIGRLSHTVSVPEP